MAKKLTDITIRNLKPDLVRREIPDSKCAGLYLVVQPTGVKSWAVRYRFNGKPVKLTLGKFSTMTLAAARKATTTAQHALEQGNNPAKARQDAKIKAATSVPNTVARIATEYMQREGHRLRTADQRESALRRLVLPVIGERLIETIERSDIIRLLDQIEDKNGPRAAHAALSLLRRIFHWHELRTDRFRSPIISGMGRISEQERARSRVLDDAELRSVWNTTANPLDPFAALVRFLLLTAARRSEAAGMCWSEIDGDVWTLPASRSKTKTEIVRPLSKAALALIEQMPQIDGCEYIFSGNGVAAFTNFSRPKTALDVASGVSGYRLHDLRRTARSLMSRAGVNADIAERCLGHAIGGVRGVYDRHRFVAEMQRAFEALAAEIARVVDPPSGEIADIATARARRR
jgi:integrase